MAPGNLIGGHYYESYPGYADFGLTIDGALALAATGDEDPALKGIVTFLADAGKDPSGNTVNTWTGIGTADLSGGSIGDEALLAEVTGYDARNFGGHDLIAALDAAVCARTTTGSDPSCAAAGAYRYSPSVFDQALGIIAQLRAGQDRQAAAPVHYLESLRNSDGSFPSLIPDSHDQDVDSTAMAVMALALVAGPAAAADVRSGVAWVASRQESDGGFPGASGDSVNSAGLAIQALTLEAASYRPQIDAALGFLAREQNPDGGFNVAAGGPRGSNLRASVQAAGGAAGTSFGTLRRDLSGTRTPPPPRTPPARQGGSRRHSAASHAPQPTVTLTPAVTPSARPRAHASPIPTVTLPGPTVVAHLRRERPLADASGSGGLVSGLWWSVLGVAIAGAGVIGGLYVRRRRLYSGAGA